MQTQTTGTANWTNEAERRRVRTVVETLARKGQLGYTAAEVAHDARNMVTALELYTELLGEPGVLAPDSLHYATELKLVVSASRRLVEKLVLLDEPIAQNGTEQGTGTLTELSPVAEMPRVSAARLPGDSIDNLARELEANCNLLDAMAGLTVSVTVKAEGGACSVRLTSEDLTRVLVNLVKNAAEAMRRSGRIDIGLREQAGEQGATKLLLTIEDSGPGIREGLLEQVFTPGFTTHNEEQGSWPATHRGLGLSITRSIVETAGGHIYAENRSEGGARIIIELPSRQR